MYCIIRKSREIRRTSSWSSKAVLIILSSRTLFIILCATTLPSVALMELPAATLLVTLALVVISSECLVVRGQSYCDKVCMNGFKHTACLYKLQTPSESCTGFTNTGLTDQERQRILQKHNRFRKKLRERMSDLQWDEELEMIAQTWANQCKFEHDRCRDVDRFMVGQNIAIYDSPDDIDDFDVARMVNMWYDEAQYFSKDQFPQFTRLNSKSGDIVGHYAQEPHPATTRLGCGAIRYKKDYQIRMLNRVFLVCNYGPGGDALIYQLPVHYDPNFEEY